MKQKKSRHKDSQYVSVCFLFFMKKENPQRLDFPNDWNRISSPKEPLWSHKRKTKYGDKLSEK